MKNYARGISLGFLAVICITSLAWSTTKVHRMYEGKPLPPDQIARVLANANVEVDSTDWKDISTFSIIGDNSTEVQFLPGPHVIVARYCAIWNIGPGDSDHDTIKSEYLTLRFKAEAGHVYRVAYPKLMDVDRARVFAKKPDLWIEDTQTGTRLEQLAESAFPQAVSAKAATAATPAPAEPAKPTPPAVTPAQPVAPATPVAVSVPTPSPTPPASTVSAGSDEVSTLQWLKFGWQKATPAERTAFREWIQKNP